MRFSARPISTFIVALWISTGLSHGQNQNEPFQAMTKTIGWMEKLESFDFEVTAITNTKSVSPIDPKNGSSGKRIEKFREFKSLDGAFFIAKSEGLLRKDSRDGTDSTVELSINRCIHGDKVNAETIAFDNGQERLCNSYDSWDGKNCDSVARGFDWGESLSLP